jgi:Tol biopolymer transport system component
MVKKTRHSAAPAGRLLPLQVACACIFVLAVAAAGSAPAAVTAGKVGAASATSGGVIALTGSAKGDSFQIYLFHVASGRLSQLTHGPRAHMAWGWSPNGSRLLVTEENGLYAMRADGSSQVRLAANPEWNRARWSPDGKRVAYIAVGSLYVVNADGTRRRLLTGGVQFGSEFNPEFSWSPDGQKIVFVSSEGLSTVTTRGVPVVQPLSFELPDPTSTTVWEPNWSPDGSRIAFMTQTSPTVSIAVMQADGSDVKVLAGDDGHGPVWSPDGSRIAFRAAWAPGVEVLRPDGTGTRTWGPSSWSGITFSPQSNRLAFVGGAGRLPNGDLFIASVNGSKPKRVLHLRHLGFELPLWRGGTATTETGP